MSKHIIYIFSFLVAMPCLGIFINTCLGKLGGYSRARIASWILFIAFTITFSVTISYYNKQINLIYWGFNLSNLNFFLASLILFTTSIVSFFSTHYMHGDKKYTQFFTRLNLLCLSLLLLIFANNLVIFNSFWLICNLLLVYLMVHKSSWQSAVNAGKLALKNLLLGSLGLLFATIVMYINTGTLSILAVSELSSNLTESVKLLIILPFIATAMLQCAQFPFNKWLLSSLNSPTGVSAIMHAGLVNGGGILLIKLNPLFYQNITISTVIFTIGTVSALLGTAYKLVQTDIKRILACSTMAQMGFMMMEIGLGLYTAAVAHIFFHSLFKSYLFLNSGSSVSRKSNVASLKEITIWQNITIAMIAVFGAAIFAKTIALNQLDSNASFFLVVIVGMFSANIMYSVLKSVPNFGFSMLGALLCLGVCFLYGITYKFIENLLPNLSAIPTQNLNTINIIALAVFTIAWFIGFSGIYNKMHKLNFTRKLYMWLVNSSQPATNTITSLRNNYRI